MSTRRGRAIGKVEFTLQQYPVCISPGVDAFETQYLCMADFQVYAVKWGISSAC